MSGLTFDAGGLIALDRNDRRVLVLVARAAECGMRVTIPALRPTLSMPMSLFVRAGLDKPSLPATHAISSESLLTWSC